MYSTAYCGQILMELEIFSTDFRKNIYAIINFMKTHPGEVQLFHADVWTDSHDEANNCFS